MKCASRLPLLRSTAYCYVRTRYIDIVYRQLVAKSRNGTKAVQLEVRTDMQPVLRTKNYVRQIGVKWYYSRVLYAVEFSMCV